MKKVVFKWVSTVIDYTSEIEAKKDAQRLKKKGWITHSEQWTANETFEGQSQCYTVEYKSPYNSNYNTGY